MNHSAVQLDNLTIRYPLPISHCEIERFTDSAIIHGVTIELAGFATEVGNECITGSAAALDGAPLLRAYMELLERLSLLIAMKRREPLTLRDAEGTRVGLAPAAHMFPESPEPLRWKWARSNGVAIATSWTEAARRGRLELIERDRVLRSFYGETMPTRVRTIASEPPLALHEAYSFETYVFDGPGPNDAHAVGVFGFPRRGGPMVYGFGARAELEDAARAAVGECLQRLGFLFGEEIPDAPPPASPTPDFHQDYFLFPGNQERLRRWLDGGHREYWGCLRDSYSNATEEPMFADLTPPALEGQLFVAKAIPNGHVPLAFGTDLPMLKQDAPAAIAVHPIA